MKTPIVNLSKKIQIDHYTFNVNPLKQADKALVDNALQIYRETNQNKVGMAALTVLLSSVISAHDCDTPLTLAEFDELMQKDHSVMNRLTMALNDLMYKPQTEMVTNNDGSPMDVTLLPFGHRYN